MSRVAARLRQTRAVAGFQPSDLAGLALWFEAGALGLSAGAAVATWPDRSGNARDATQATGSKQPTYQINQLSGRPAVVFDGTADALLTAGFTAIPTTTILAAARSTDTLGRNVCDGTVSGRHLLGFRSGAFTAYQGGALSAGPAANTNPHVLTGLFAGDATSRIAVDGTLAAASNIGAATLAGLAVGSDWTGNAEWWAGSIAELIVYSGILSAGNRQTVERYLGAKYGIAVA